MRGDRDRQPHDAPRPVVLREPHQAAQRRIVARDHGLPRAVVVGHDDRPVVGGLADQRAEHAVAQPDDRGHPPGPAQIGVAHQLAAAFDQPQRVVEVDRAGREHRGDLPHAVPGDDGRAELAPGRLPRGAQRFEPGDAGHEDRRLRVLGLVEVFHGAPLDQAQQVVIEQVVGALEPVLGGRVDLEHLAGHADGLRALAGEDERVGVVGRGLAGGGGMVVHVGSGSGGLTRRLVHRVAAARASPRSCPLIVSVFSPSAVLSTSCG